MLSDQEITPHSMKLHHPYHICRFSYFDAGRKAAYFDEAFNRDSLLAMIERKVAPALDGISQSFEPSVLKKPVRLAITGVFVEQCLRYAPDCLERIRLLAASRCVEFYKCTYFNSAAEYVDADEIAYQVSRHTHMIAEQFGVRPVDKFYPFGVPLVLNRIQELALSKALSCGRLLKFLVQDAPQAVDGDLLEIWRKLISMDHFAAMATQSRSATENSHTGMNPFENPYEAFINYMNVLRDFELRISGLKKVSRLEPTAVFTAAL